MFRIVLCNVPLDKADEIAKFVIEQHFVACVNLIHNVSSYYIWNNKLCHDQEVTLVMKTMTSKVEKLTQAIQQIHPYECPEIISIPINETEGNLEYLAWVKASLSL